jgi:hypothetical protein
MLKKDLDSSIKKCKFIFDYFSQKNESKLKEQESLIEAKRKKVAQLQAKLVQMSNQIKQQQEQAK